MVLAMVVAMVVAMEIAREPLRTFFIQVKQDTMSIQQHWAIDLAHSFEQGPAGQRCVHGHIKHMKHMYEAHL